MKMLTLRISSQGPVPLVKFPHEQQRFAEIGWFYSEGSEGGTGGRQSLAVRVSGQIENQRSMQQRIALGASQSSLRTASH
jgi:hypothetical protein